MWDGKLFHFRWFPRFACSADYPPLFSIYYIQNVAPAGNKFRTDRRVRAKSMAEDLMFTEQCFLVYQVVLLF